MMRVSAPFMVVMLAAAGVARAQNSQSEIAVPPAPPVVAAPPAVVPAAPAAPPPPPGLVQSPVPTEAVPDEAEVPTASASGGAPNSGQAPSSQSASSAVPPPDVAPPAPDQWVMAHTAVLGVLNKVDGSTSQISVPVGGRANVGGLQVGVQACASRPDDELPDAAVFLTIQAMDGSDPAQLYRGWIIRSVPGATTVGNAGETFRIINCS